MEKIIINKDNLKDEDMTEVIKKVKVMLINSKNEILIGYSYNCYQFPGGTHEEGEELIETINREIEEETGIVLNATNLEPFACSFGYYKDWPKEGINRKIEIYYYKMMLDELPHLDNTNYTDAEIEGKFELRYLPLDGIEEVLIKNAEEYPVAIPITNELLELFKVYRKLKD